MRRREEGISEIVSFLLILAVIVAGIAIFTATALPELEKSRQTESENTISDTFFELKTRIDQLWLFEKTASTPIYLSDTGGCVWSDYQQNAPIIFFNHSEGQTAASLLTVTCEGDFSSFAYEGGAVFSGNQKLLPPSMSETHAILITSPSFSEGEVLAANRPILLHISGGSSAIYTDLSDLQVSGSPHSAYWREELSGITTLTLIDCTITMEAVA